MAMTQQHHQNSGFLDAAGPANFRKAAVCASFDGVLKAPNHFRVEVAKSESHHEGKKPTSGTILMRLRPRRTPRGTTVFVGCQLLPVAPTFPQYFRETH